MEYKYYHNPNCSTCQKGLKILSNRGITPTLIHYLDEGLDSEDIVEISKKLEMHPKEFVREKELKEIGVADTEFSVEEWSEIISENPRILQRPILLTETVAILGRPPENFLSL